MSYELDHIEKSCPCPCGKGNIVYGSGSNDWNQVREGMIEIWCPDCSSKYRFVDGGLLPKDFPEYVGDSKLWDQINDLKNEIANYKDMFGFRYWPKPLLKKRMEEYLLPNERCERDQKQKQYYRYVAFVYAKSLCADYKKEELITALSQMNSARYSTELEGVAKELAIRHKHRFHTIRLSNVIYPLDVAVRNYEAYREADIEDKEHIMALEKELGGLEKEYCKDYPAYAEKRSKSLIKFTLKETRR